MVYNFYSGKNALGQSNFEVLKSAISQYQQGQSSWCFVWWDSGFWFVNF